MFKCTTHVHHLFSVTVFITWLPASLRLQCPLLLDKVIQELPLTLESLGNQRSWANSNPLVERIPLFSYFSDPFFLEHFYFAPQFLLFKFKFFLFMRESFQNYEFFLIYNPPLVKVSFKNMWRSSRVQRRSMPSLVWINPVVREEKTDKQTTTDRQLSVLYISVCVSVCSV